MSDRIELVVLHTDDGAFGSGRLERELDAADQGVALLEHDPMIAGQIGLALAAVDDDRLDQLPRGGLHLDVARKGPAPESDQPGILHGRDDFLGRHGVEVALQIVQDLLARGLVDLEEDRLSLGAVGCGCQCDRADDPGRRGMHGHGHETLGASDRLAAHDLLADLDQRNGGRTLMLGERDGQLGRKGKPTDRFVRRQLLVLDRVDPVLEGAGALEETEKTHY